jgi:hypothetical protein
MPPPTRRERLFQEGRIALAIQANKQGSVRSVRVAAESFDVPRTTLRRRSNGTKAKLGTPSSQRRLTPIEEEVLVQWILSMDRRGMQPRVSSVRHMATLLLGQHAQDASVGKNWATKFISRHDALKSKYNRKLDYQRAKCEDPVIIRDWFQRVRTTIAEYGILDDDIYNFDETGFQMGVIATAKVVTGTDRAGRPRTTQPGNREWVTLIEAINARGFAIPPLVIFEAVMHQASWYNNLPPEWVIGVSENGWTNNEIGLFWLEYVFDKHTKNRTIGRHRLLILDGHGSHVTPEFDQYCLDHSIIVLCMPAHSSHLLQPLDVGCFAVLKRSYGRLVEQKMGLGVNHIDKIEFLPLYQQARREALIDRNIYSGFAATGLVPYDPDRVLELLNAQFKTPSPSPPSPPQSQRWTAATPQDIAQLAQQSQLINQRLKRRHRTQSPQSPTEQAFNQVVKACEMMMHTNTLLVHENTRLWTENNHQTQKRAKKRSYLQRGGLLTGAEGLSLIEAEERRLEEAIENRSNRGRQRAPPRCSLCESLEHKAPKCPTKQATQ